MNIRHQIEYTTVAGLLALSRRIPERWVFSLFRGFGHVSYFLISRRRKTALMNTAVVFPEMTEQQRRRIVKRHFAYMAESLALNTLIMSGRITNEQLFEMVEAEHWDRLAGCIENAPHGVLVISAHIGNWELMVQYAALRLGINSHVIARETNNPLLEQRIMLPLRERFGIQVFYKKNAIRNILHATRKGEPAGIMIDQKLNVRYGIATDFFGRTAGTTPTPAVLQIRFGITVIPVFMIRAEGPGQYKMIIREPVSWQDNGKPMESQVAELTAKHQKIVEEIILEYPEQWFWVHDRWELWKQRKKK